MSDHDSRKKENINTKKTGSSADFKPVNFQKQTCLAPSLKAFRESSCESWTIGDLSEESSSGAAPDSKYRILSWAVAHLANSPAARAMLKEAEKENWSFALESLGGPDFHLDVPEKLIVLDNQDLMTGALGRSEYFKNAVLVSMIRALRDVWQEKRHGAFDVQYGPEAVLMLERIRAADLDILAVLVGWELRGEGKGSLWRHLIGSEDGDIAMRFSGFLERDPSSLFNGKALAAAFTQWFRNDRRVDSCDHEVLNYLDSIVECSDSCEESFGCKKLTHVGTETLSCLPDKTAYLQGQGREILGNPLYAGLTDPINQAHFMQIIYDLKVVRIQSVPFRDARLAEMIFPGGEFTPDEEDAIH
jgi:hypothetical protein